ncbi:MAG: cytochrome c biogenesis protein CcsA [Chloroflexi bacterium]|nr:cytochrome c biogenesis protein CcsA [Chloroflexota bacterium]
MTFQTGPRWGMPLASIAGTASVLALAMIFFYVPPDRLQGIVQKIFYLHVPAAWIAYLAFFVVLVGSIGYLWQRNLAWDRVARASAEIGVLFTTLVLVLGSLWAKPIWNTWWTWDARLTSTLVLWFIYVGYLMLRAYTPDQERSARFGAVLGIVGFADVPIIHYSVEWWRTLHPEAVVVRAQPQLPAEMGITLAVATLTVTLVYATFMLYRVHLEHLEDENRDLEASAEPPPAPAHA